MRMTENKHDDTMVPCQFNDFFKNKRDVPLTSDQVGSITFLFLKNASLWNPPGKKTLYFIPQDCNIIFTRKCENPYALSNDYV